MDIVVDVLEAAKNGVNKTAIVYRTNLNFTLAEKYLELLEKQGLLENKSDKYITSDKGKVFLAKAKEITMQLETPLHNAKEKTTQNEDASPKAKQMTLQYEEPMQIAKQMTLQYEAPMQKTQEMNLQQNLLMERLIREITIQRENPN